MKKRRKVYRLKKKPKRVIFIVLIAIILIFALISALNKPQTAKTTQHKEIIKEEEKPVREQINGVLEDEPKIEENVVEEKFEGQEPPKVEISDTYTTRMTSYYPEEGETMTASGLGINNFEINNNGWFTYDNKLVIATASTRLGYTNMRTYNLYDELIININGIDYDAIVLDVCGACQKDNRIDLFASSVIYAKDMQVIVKIK